MSDEEYSTKEERRQQRRRARYISSSPDTDRSDRDKEDEADSTGELNANMGTECKTLIHDNVRKQDVASFQLSKEGSRRP